MLNFSTSIYFKKKLDVSWQTCYKTRNPFERRGAVF